MIGQTLAHYKILSLLGKGGMGEVYCALDQKLGREVALKLLPQDKAADPERLARFEREAKAVAALNHPNIVTIHSVEEAEGHHFLTMELIEGETLFDMIPERGMDLARLFDVAIPLADALSAAHGKGITHRDLKPSNVMVDARGRVKVLDFGLAKLLADLKDGGDETLVQDDDPVTAEGKVLGTMNYMSPEQAESKELDHRSDIFSLGVLLYEMSTGARPFEGDTPISTISAILKDTPQPLSQRNARLPRHLGRVVSRCLEKNPDKRYQTARDVCNELEGLKREIESGEHDEALSGQISSDAIQAAQLRSRANPWPWIVMAVGIVAIAGYFALRGRDKSQVASREITTRPLTSFAGWETPGSWSPDGGFFVYEHSARGPADLFVASLAGGTPIELVSSEYDDVRPAWSPDNRWIAFVSGRGREVAIYLVPPLGGEPQKLVEVGLERMDFRISGALGSTPWSPDASRLLFSRRSQDGSFAVWEITLATRAARQITHPPIGQGDYMASYSSSGDRILLTRVGSAGSEILVLPAAGGEPILRQLVGAEFVFTSWGPDGKELLYSRMSGGIWRLDLRSGSSNRVTTGTTENYPIVAHDGRIIYSTASHQTDIYEQSLADGSSRRLTFHTQDNFNAAVSPDGSQFVYQATRTGDSELWLYDLASRKERQLTEATGYEGAASWHPDGEQLVYRCDRDGEMSIWALDLRATAPRRIADVPDLQFSPKVSPDGLAIGYLRSGEEASALYAMDFDGTNQRRILAEVAAFTWYGDSNHVIYTPSETERATQIRVVDLATGQDELLLDTSHDEIAVSRDGKALSYISSLSHSNMNLFLLRLEVDPNSGMPRAVGQPEQLTQGAGEWHVHNGSISSDGSRVYYTRDTDAGDLYLMEGVF